MKLNNLLKSIPFILTCFFLLLINIGNQNTSTKLKILIWNTPSLSLSTYLSISTTAGFIFSYILTTNLASIITHNSVKPIQYKSENLNEETNKYNFSNYKNNNEKILIERNVNDPLPTVNAQFRVIGKTERYSKNIEDNNNIQYEKSYVDEESYIDQSINKENIKLGEDDTADWNDDSHTSW